MAKLAVHMSEFTIYSTRWCGYCRQLKSQLTRAGIAFHEVDIEQVQGAAEIVAKANNGNETVPTVVFADGSALTNPSVGDIAEKLAAIS